MTDKVLANQQILTANIAISTQLEKYSAVQILAEAERSIAMQIDQAIHDAILNADSLALAAGNINSNDQLASTTYGATASIVNYDDGLRKGIVNGIANTDYINFASATSGFADIARLIKLLPSDFDPSMYGLIMDSKTYADFMAKDDFKNAYQRANTLDTNTIQTGKLERIA